MSHRRPQSIVDFQPDFGLPDETECEQGKYMAELLANELRALGFPVSETSPGPQMGDVVFWYSMRCRSGAKEYEISVGAVPNSRWWIECPPRLGFFAKLLGRTEHNEHEKLLRAIAEILERHPAVTKIRWFRKMTNEEELARWPYYASPTASTPTRKRIPARNAWEAFQDITNSYSWALSWFWLVMMGVAVLAFGFGVERIAGLDTEVMFRFLFILCQAWLLFTGLGFVWLASRLRKESLAEGEPMKLIPWAIAVGLGIILLCLFVGILFLFWPTS